MMVPLQAKRAQVRRENATESQMFRSDVCSAVSLRARDWCQSPRHQNRGMMRTCFATTERSRRIASTGAASFSIAHRPRPRPPKPRLRFLSSRGEGKAPSSGCAVGIGVPLREWTNISLEPMFNRIMILSKDGNSVSPVWWDHCEPV